MDSFELNKIAGAILATLLVVVGVKVVGSELFEPHHPEKPGFEIAVPEDAGASSQVAAAPQVEPIAVRLAEADSEKGMASAKKCMACHSFEKGGTAKVGPNLYEIVERNHAASPGFAYSKAMQAHAGEVWSYDMLDHFLENPKKAIPGTSMNFAGIRKPDERANVIAYLRTLADAPKPLPEATGATTPDEGGQEGEEQPARASN